MSVGVSKSWNDEVTFKVEIALFYGFFISALGGYHSCLIDVDIRAVVFIAEVDFSVVELDNEGTIENSKHIPRGMLEFWLDPSSHYYKEEFSLEKKKILFCAQGMRSALAAKTLKDMGFTNVAHVKGGFEALKKFDFKIVEVKKK